MACEGLNAPSFTFSRPRRLQGVSVSSVCLVKWQTVSPQSMAQGTEGRSFETYFLAARLRSCFFFILFPSSHPKMQRTNNVPRHTSLKCVRLEHKAELRRMSASAGKPMWSSPDGGPARVTVTRTFKRGGTIGWRRACACVPARRWWSDSVPRFVRAWDLQMQARSSPERHSRLFEVLIFRIFTSRVTHFCTKREQKRQVEALHGGFL